MKLYIIRTIALLFFSLFVMTPNAIAEEKPSNILLLNSYHKGFVWTDDITHGIEVSLKDEPIELHVEYMDTKRQFDTIYQGLLLKLLQHKHKKHQYKLIVTSDNNAFEFVKSHRDSLFGNIPVVFTGVNYVGNTELSGFSNVTGINEKANIKDNVLLIKKLHPDCDTIKIIVDNTTTGKRLQKQVLSFREQLGSDVSIKLVYDLTIDELTKQLKKEPQGNIVLFTLFFRDKENRFIEYDEGAKLVCKNSSVPVYGTWTFSLGYGIVGGYLTNGYDQGILAGQQVLQIINGVDINSIPIEMNPPSSSMYDYRELEKNGISISDLPVNSMVKYKPPTFFQKYKNGLRNLFYIIGFLVSTVVILLYAIQKVDSARKDHLNSKAQLRTIIDSIPSLVFINNIEGKFLLANKAVSRLFSPNINIVEGKSIADLFPNKDILERIHTQNQEVLNFPNNIHVSENSYPTNNNKAQWFRTVKIACPPNLFGEPAILGASVDITQLKETEDALKKAKKFAENLLETANTLIIGLDIHANIKTFNRYAEELTGYTKHEVLDKNWFETFIPINDKSVIPKVFKDVLNGMPEVSQVENQIKTKNGKLRLINWNNSLIKTENGIIEGVLSIGVDTTERSFAENEIKKSENKFKSIFKNSPLGIIYYDSKGVILDCNETFIKLIGSSKEQLLGLNMVNLPDKRLVDTVQTSLHKGLGMYEDYYKSTTANKVTPVKGTFKGIKDANGNITGGIGIIEDITQQKNAENEIILTNEKLQAANTELVKTANALQQSNKELSQALVEAKKSKELEIANKLLIKQKEELNITLNKLKETQTQLIQAEKLASIGVLTSGIAHEINNPLNFIQGGKTAIELHLFDNMPEHTESFSPFIEMIDTGINRASKIVQSLSHFNRKTDSYDEVLFLHKIIDNCLTMLENKLKYKVEVKKQYACEKFNLKGNEGKMHQVFLNILTNAEQAIEKNGQISIVTKLTNKHITIQVNDSGNGISKDNLARIGEPFFTTKKAGEGTGLGLSITKSIIKDHNGTFKIESEINQGTTVTIKLPVNK